MKKVVIQKWFPLVLGLLIVLFFLPLLLGGGGLFVGETARYFYPQQVFISRNLARGIIPWWDPHVFAGASPLYTRSFQSALYPLNWVFIFLGNVFPGGDSFWLWRLPLFLHYLGCAGFSYLFARRGIGLGRTGSAALALAYTLSPVMTSPQANPATVFALTWLPLLCLVVAGYFRTGRLRQLLSGVLLVALVSPAGAVPAMMGVLPAVILFSLGLAAAGRAAGNRLGARRAVSGAAAIVILGLLLAGIYWSGALMGISSAARDSVLAGRTGRPFAPFLPAALFSPDFFGAVTARGLWGPSAASAPFTGEGRLLGGLLLLSAVAFGFRAVVNPPSGRPSPIGPRGIWWVFSGMLLLSLAAVAGLSAPLARLLPVLKGIEPGSGNIIQSFSLAALAGVSVDLLQKRPPARPLPGAISYLKAAGVVLILAMLVPVGAAGRWFFPGFRQLIAESTWAAFLSGQLVYLAAAGGLLVLLAKRFRGELFVRLFFFALAAELFLFAYLGLYRGRVFDLRRGEYTVMRSQGPADHPLYRSAEVFRRTAGSEDQRYRRMHGLSGYDNLSRLDGSLSVLGYPGLGIERPYLKALLPVAEGLPRLPRPERWGARFWRNMSVRFFYSRRHLPVSGFRQAAALPGYYQYEVDNVLPRFYFQDRFVHQDVWEEQMRALLEYDLREHSFIHHQTWDRRPLPELFGPAEEMDHREWSANFDRLQSENRVLKTDLSNPNRVVLDVDVSGPALLVTTDLWHPGWRVVTDTGIRETLRLHRVNYLQRGVWCLPGRYRIIMEYMPASLVPGLVMTWLGLLGLIVLSYYTFRRDARKGQRDLSGPR